MQQSSYLTQSESADFLRLSERTLERWRVEGMGPPFRRFGRRVVYAKADLERWADSRCFESTCQETAKLA
jgi:DNA-binding transcriptional MerR regulator